MKLINLFYRYFKKESETDADFATYLNKEMLQSELLRSNIVIGLFSMFAIGGLVPPLFGFHIVDRLLQLTGLYLALAGFYFTIIAYELIVRFVIKRNYRKKNSISNWIRYGNASEEVSLPTIGMLVVAHIMDPIEVLLGPASFLYFIFITVSALRLDFWLSVFTGLVAAIEYYLLTLYFLYHSNQTADLSIYMEGSIYPKCFILILTGLIMGIVTLEIKRRILASYHFMKDQNRLLEEKVKQRTEELESLNQNLQKRVQEEVKSSREKEQLLIQQSKMSAMGEMISMIAHQWRQPLSSIGTIVGNLNVRYQINQLDGDEFDRSIEDINHQIQYLSDTITDFRKFLSPTRKQEYSVFTSIVDNSLKIIGKSLQNKNIQLEKDYSYNQEILTFPNELMQVLINILKNAQDALVENQVSNPLIKLSGGENQNNLEFLIEDNAGGIPEDVIQNIFEPYFTTKTNSDGTGLGLYMSKTIIEKHCNGKLTVDNKEQGASFRIELPLTS